MSQRSATARSAPAPFTVKLRSYIPADFEKIHAIDQACYEPRIAYSRTELRQYLRFPGADCVVAEAWRENAAPAMIGFCITAHKYSWGYVVTMDVLAEYRRHRVGSILLTEAERRLVAAGVRQIGLETATDNAPAIAFWQKHDYRKSGVRKNYYPGGRDAYSMAKRIASGEMTAKAGPHR